MSHFRTVKCVQCLMKLSDALKIPNTIRIDIHLPIEAWNTLEFLGIPWNSLEFPRKSQLYLVRLLTSICKEMSPMYL